MPKRHRPRRPPVRMAGREPAVGPRPDGASQSAHGAALDLRRQQNAGTDDHRHVARQQRGDGLGIAAVGNVQDVDAGFGLQKFAGQEFEGQVAPGSEDARPLWEELDQALRAANWVRVAPSGLAVGDPPAGIPLSPNSGVTVFVTASRANELAPTAHALAAALMAEGLIAGVTASAGPRMEQRPNVIVIEIGRKPS